MRKLALLLALIFAVQPAHADSVSIWNMPAGGTIQTGDRIPVSRCGTSGCSYYTSVGAMATLGIPSAGLALSTGTGFGTPVTNNSTNWNTAYGWGNHASAGYLTANQTITLSGDITGSGTTGIAASLANTATARSHLGLGSIATQSASSVAITGGTIQASGITLSTATGSTQCAQFDANGALSGAGTTCGYTGERKTLLLSQTVTAGSSAVSFTAGMSSTYNRYEVRAYNLLPTSTAVTVRLQVGNGGTYYTSDYAYVGTFSNVASAWSIGSNSAASIELSYDLATTTAAGGFNGVFTIVSPSATTAYKKILYDSTYWADEATDGPQVLRGWGTYAGTGALTDVKLLANGGTFASGIVELWGVKQ